MSSYVLLQVFKAVFLLVFVGWVMIWVMLPTKVYSNTWRPNLDSLLNSTYMSSQGTNLLLYSFPIMFIAAFGSLHLHLQKKLKKSSSKSKWMSFGRRPLFVMSPLGIVSTMEVAFSGMFVALLIWSLANYLYVSFGHLHMHKEGEKVWEAKFRSVSLRLGYIGNTCWAFLFFPVTRSSSILGIVGLTTESSIKYHIWLGHVSMVLFAAHTVGFIIYWGITDQMAEMLEWSKTYVSNVAGVIATVFAAAMWVTSFQRTRRKMFEVFFYTHYLYVLYIIFYALHVGAAYFCTILPGIFLFIIDRYLRFLQSRQRARLVSARVLPCDVVELNFSKHPELRYNPMSVLFVHVPSISKLQWHPFTVTSNCDMEPDKLSVVIKTQGSWSRKLYQQISNTDQLDISVEGPYGPTLSNFLKHELLVMVSGGSGITPCVSILREIIYESRKPSCQIPGVLLVCAFKKSVDLSMLDLLLPTDNLCEKVGKIQLQIEAYITREQEPTTEHTENMLQTIRFKPNPTDKPISRTLGPNNWLWLAAIIASSFIMFLLLLGTITRYYIYPIGHNTNELYHYSYYVLWDLFLVCACIFMACSAAFVMSKRGNDKEVKQIQNVEMQTPTLSPSLWFDNGESRELESHPYQSLVQATKVFYGARPDLKKILIGYKEEDVGVMACGPKQMRHDVAKICGSGLANNLHYESISFNW